MTFASTTEGRLGSAAGSVAILNVGAGDIALSFDKSNPAECIRAARVVRDMLKRGYALLIEVERDGVKKFVRALDFDENVCSYVIADFDPAAEAPATPAHVEDMSAEDTAPLPTREQPSPKATPKSKKTKVPAEKTRAVAVARIAGG